MSSPLPSPGGARLRARRAWWQRACLALATALLMTGCVPRAPGSSPAPSSSPTVTGSGDVTTTASRLPLLGAYYYSWYPENLAGGSLGSHLVPPTGPDPRTEVSADPATAQRAIAQATSAGIDFLTLDWWPTNPARNARIDSGFLKAPNLNSIHFSILYETQDLGAGIPYQTNTPMTSKAKAKLVSDMTAIADRYFANPQYLRIDGRPVIFWYLTRTLTGDVAGAVADVRAALAKRGYNVLLIGDEIFWRVVTTGDVLTTAPQVGRARLFDAITWYNLYDSVTPAFSGYGASSTFLASVNRLLQTYQTSLGGTVPIVPSVIPGYNDRATRPTENHAAIPRMWAPGGSDGSFLQHMFDDVALPNVDPRLPMVMITSWNEWNEQTAIEPLPSAPATSVDDSASGTSYTQGYTYGGSGTGALDVVRKVAARRIPATAGSG